jgi:hypothetical protein
MTEFITKEEVRTILARTNPVGVDAETYMVKVINLAIAQKFEVASWSLRFKYGDSYEKIGPVNDMTTFSTEERANEYADKCSFDWKGQHISEKRPIVTPIYALKRDSK